MLKKFILKLYVPVIVIFVFGWGCTKLDTTNLGGDLIPVVDNVNTFDTVLSVNATQGIFADTTVTNLFNDQVLGTISNDPLFGTTKADMYLQLKPSAYPFTYGSLGDTLDGFGAGLDSAVLCISYKGYWGDNTIPQTLEVREISDNNFTDSTQRYVSLLNTYEPRDRRISYRPNTTGGLLGSTTVDITKLNDTIPVGGTLINANKERVVRQIRVKLSQTYAALLYKNDILPINPLLSDSNFRRIFHGLAVTAGNGGNALMYTSLSDANTRLEVHYRKRNAGKLDTVFSTFKMALTGSTTQFLSASANTITRNRSGYPVSNPSTNEIYLQTTPGTYVNLTAPGISNLNNRVIHRAELILQQVPHNTFFDTAFKVPDYLYLDLVDTTLVPNWKPIYFDLNPYEFYDPDVASAIFPSSINYNYYGGIRRTKVDQFGNGIRYYNFNITRHLQRIVTKNTPNYTFRLFAPYVINYPSLSIPLTYPNNLALGRVRLGSGTHPDYKMILRIVYSKI